MICKRIVTLSLAAVFAAIGTIVSSSVGIAAPAGTSTPRCQAATLPGLTGALPSIPPGAIVAPTNVPRTPPAGLALSTPPPNGSISLPPIAPGPPGGPSLPPCALAAGNIQAAIYAAAEAFIGTRTCGLHGADGADACMASVNQILMNAGIPPIGPPPDGTNYIPTAVLAYGSRLQPIPQADTVPGDLMVRHSPGDTYTSSGGEEHIVVCTVPGCTQTVSNASHDCTFGWQSDDTLCYAGSPYCNGYSDFYRVLP